MLRGYFEKKRIKNIFAKYLSTDTIDQVLSGAMDLNNFRESIIAYCIIIIKNDEIKKSLGIISLIINLALEKGIDINTICSNLLIMSCGTLPQIRQNTESMKQFGNECINTFSDKIKMTVCTTNAHIGNLGNNKRMAYSFLTSTFIDNLKKTVDMPYGEIKYIE